MKLAAKIAALALLLSIAGSTPAATTCDRACLEKLLDTYLGALVAHDPKRLPLAPGARFTENGQALPPGDGLWGTIDFAEAAIASPSPIRQPARSAPSSR